MGTLLTPCRLSVRFHLPIIMAALGLLLLGSGCVEKKMSVKEAQMNGIKAQYYQSQGQNAQAEPYLRRRLDSLMHMVDRNSRLGIWIRNCTNCKNFIMKTYLDS